MTRLFLSGYISDDNDKITLGSEDSHYIISVLRMRKGEELILVDPDSNELLCEVLETSKDACTVSVKERKKSVSESMIDITLYQSVSKGERMDLTIQKSVELGVKKIVPVFSERCVVRPESDEKKRTVGKRDGAGGWIAGPFRGCVIKGEGME